MGKVSAVQTREPEFESHKPIARGSHTHNNKQQPVTPALCGRVGVEKGDSLSLVNTAGQKVRTAPKVVLCLPYPWHTFRLSLPTPTTHQEKKTTDALSSKNYHKVSVLFLIHCIRMCRKTSSRSTRLQYEFKASLGNYSKTLG